MLCCVMLGFEMKVQFLLNTLARSGGYGSPFELFCHIIARLQVHPLLLQRGLISVGRMPFAWQKKGKMAKSVMMMGKCMMMYI